MRGTGIAAVAAREVAWIRRDPVALLLLFVAPLLAFTVLAGTFSNVVIRGLHVDIVDADRSQTSASFVQAISAAPGVDVAARSGDLTGAMHAVRSGAAIAAVYIPENFERDVLAGRRPQIVDLYNKQYFTPGNIASSGIQAAITSAAAALPNPPGRAASFTPGTLDVEQYVLSNPALNYAQFLLRAIMPTVLHVMVAIAGAFAVGSEFGRRRKAGEWLETAGGSPLTALIGKLAPYLGVFILLMAGGLGVIHGLFAVPFRGNALLAGASALLLMSAYLSLGALFVLLVRNLPLALSLTGIVCSPAFGFAGVGFPVLGMGPFAQAWGTMLPLRWYIQILFDQAARGVPAVDSLGAFRMLAGLAVLYFALAWLRARSVLRNPPVPAEAVAPGAHSFGLVGSFRAEYGRVLRDSGALGLIILGPVLYSALYPQPYVGQLVRDIPIAVVDDDNSEISRALVQTLDAHEAIKVVARPLNLTDAQAAIARREVYGVVSIPEGTERDILKGRKARIPAFVDSAYFLVYNRTLQGISEAASAASIDILAGSARPDGSLYRAALVRSSQVELLSQPLFNPTGAYGAYVVPAAFILILQQTLVMGVATLGGVAYEEGAVAARRRRGQPLALIGQALAHLALALPAYVLYLVVMPHIYGYAASPHLLDLLVLSIPFILAVSFLGQALGALAKRRETAVIILVGFGLPLFFLVGVAWPQEAIPAVVRTASAAIPSTFGIDAMVRINQMGASVADVAADWRGLWILVGVYAVLAFLLSRLGAAEEKPA
ncbi:ABC transporter permease [Labrys okinawensis]|uniref:ABC transporter permease n=1 Tax=Labrys okinawensis TaxID=346911 RepID=UPI0039BCB7FA